jgi:hypothetical protein
LLSRARVQTIPNGIGAKGTNRPFHSMVLSSPMTTKFLVVGPGRRATADTGEGGGGEFRSRRESLWTTSKINLVMNPRTSTAVAWRLLQSWCVVLNLLIRLKMFLRSY